MKKFMPYLFIAIMAGLVGAKFAVASELPVAATAAQVEAQQ